MSSNQKSQERPGCAGQQLHRNQELEAVCWQVVQRAHKRDGMFVWSWNDQETDATGWIAVEGSGNEEDMKRPLVAGGGLFMWRGATEDEVIHVAKMMTDKLKVTCAPEVRGAKGGIRFDHRDARAEAVLRRFFRDNADVLKNVWATGEDLNTRQEVLDRIAREELAIPNCLYALSCRYPDASPRTVLALETPRDLVHFDLSETSVGYGMACALRELVRSRAPQLEGSLRVGIQGFGTVGSTFAFHLVNMKLGVVVAIADREQFVTCPPDQQGLDIIAMLQHRDRSDAQDKTLLSSCVNPQWEAEGKLTSSARYEDESDEAYLCRFLDSYKADVFSPCALRYILTEAVMQHLARGTYSDTPHRFLISGANNVSTDTDKLLLPFLSQENISMVPEWVSNCGTACLFMQACTQPPPKADGSPVSVYENILQSIDKSVTKFVQRARCESGNEHRLLYPTCMRIARSLSDA